MDEQDLILKLRLERDTAICKIQKLGKRMEALAQCREMVDTIFSEEHNRVNREQSEETKKLGVLVREIAELETKLKSEPVAEFADPPSCPDCGGLMVRNDGCYKCTNCGTQLGCS